MMDLRSTKLDLEIFRDELERTEKRIERISPSWGGVDETENDCGGEDRVIIADREAGRKCIENEPAKWHWLGGEAGKVSGSVFL